MGRERHELDGSDGPRIRTRKVSELVAEELRQQIVTSQLADGDELPRESEMIRDFGVSRPSVREALRILETERLVRIRRGNVGGAVVQHPDAASAAHHLGLTLRAANVTVDDLAAARLSIEPVCAALAAESPDREAIAAELTKLVGESEVVQRTKDYTRAAHHFHLRLTQLCGNKTLAILAGTLEAIWTSQEWRLIGAECSKEGDSRRRSIEAHQRLISAISRGRQQQAALEMRRHLEDMQAITTDAYGETLIELQGSSVPGRSLVPAPSSLRPEKSESSQPRTRKEARRS